MNDDRGWLLEFILSCFSCWGEAESLSWALHKEGSSSACFQLNLTRAAAMNDHRRCCWCWGESLSWDHIVVRLRIAWICNVERTSASAEILGLVHTSVWRYPKFQTIPIPILFSDTKYFRYRYRYLFRYQIFSIPVPRLLSRYKILPIPVPRLFPVPIFSDTGSDTTKKMKNSRYRYVTLWLLG